MIDQIKPLIGKLCSFSQKRLGFSKPPKLFIQTDRSNSQKVLGKTAFYNPGEKSITLFVHGRHPKDILRSFAHELVHHSQNERGDLDPSKMTNSGKNYAQECPHMRKMEKEAYLKGNMCFRDWEDTIENKDKFLIKIAESKFLKENKTMTTKITKEFLKEAIRKILKEEDAFSMVKPDGMSDEDYYEYAQRNDNLKTTERYKKIQAEKDAAAKKKKPSAGEAFAQFAQDIGALKEEEELEEGKKCPSCDGDAPKSECVCKEIEEASQEEFAKNRPPYDKATAADRAGDDGKQKNESKIQTPEQENSLYESRFTPKNNRLFEKLVKQWAK
tara:strand:- start:44 stop:1030 length:987 start_codon:yes stop_codon:yes gene_type:complete